MGAKRTLMEHPTEQETRDAFQATVQQCRAIAAMHTGSDITLALIWTIVADRIAGLEAERDDLRDGLDAGIGHLQRGQPVQALAAMSDVLDDAEVAVMGLAGFAFGESANHNEGNQR